MRIWREAIESVQSDALTQSSQSSNEFKVGALPCVKCSHVFNACYPALAFPADGGPKCPSFYFFQVHITTTLDSGISLPRWHSLPNLPGRLTPLMSRQKLFTQYVRPQGGLFKRYSLRLGVNLTLLIKKPALQLSCIVRKTIADSEVRVDRALP